MLLEISMAVHFSVSGWGFVMAKCFGWCEDVEFFDWNGHSVVIFDVEWLVKLMIHGGNAIFIEDKSSHMTACFPQFQLASRSKKKV